jgi:glycosyltransferase involved in cell wall biosynthesis
MHFGPAEARPQRDLSKPLRIIYVGRMIEEQKRVSRLVELAKTLTTRGLRFEFTFAGSGPELGPTREALKEFPNVRFLGDVKNSEIGSLLRLNDVFVLLSDYEGLPLSLIEAMGEGVVPVVSDLESGMRDVVTPENGVRVPVGDIAAAADSIAVLALDPARLASISAAASGFARTRHSSATMAESYLKLVSELAKGEPSWESDVPVPAPVHFANSWLYRGLPRVARRILKRFNV